MGGVGTAAGAVVHGVDLLPRLTEQHHERDDDDAPDEEQRAEDVQPGATRHWLLQTAQSRPCRRQ